MESVPWSKYEIAKQVKNLIKKMKGMIVNTLIKAKLLIFFFVIWFIFFKYFVAKTFEVLKILN